VCGDLAECGVSGFQTLREILGLVVRRHLSLWADWRPWLALLAIAIPTGIVLSQLSEVFVQSATSHLGMYEDRFWVIWENPGGRRDFLQSTALKTLDLVTVAAWSASSGFALRALSRRTLWLTGSLFIVASLAGALGTTNGILRIYQTRGPFEPPWELWYPGLEIWVSCSALVLVPAVWGMKLGGRHPLPSPLLTTVGVLILSALTLNEARILGQVMVFNHAIRAEPCCGHILLQLDAARRGALGLLVLLMIWPVAFIAGAAIWQRWHARDASPPVAS
jgi:hypothetical protein